jgi:hypothetical protein
MSKLRISIKFSNVLKAMGRNKIAMEILSNANTEMKLVNNYIDVGSNNDGLIFTTERKAAELINDIRVYYIVNGTGNLLFKNSNRKIFGALEFDMTSPLAFQIPQGTIGEILNEVVSEQSGKTYCLFKEKDGERIGVINKQAIQPYDPNYYQYYGENYFNDDCNGSISPWYNAIDVHVGMITKSRNPIRIGRLVRTLLKEEYTDSKIEEFVNLYKSTYDVLGNAFKKFDIVDGEEIQHWYKKDNYVSGGGTLNSSCMAESAKTYFNIYVKNDNVKMVILYDDEGTIKDEKYTSKKIKGRAILWSCEIDGVKETYMDRIYTKNDSDVNLFKEFAKENGWWFKEHQDMEPDQFISNGLIRKRATIKVSLTKVRTGKLPYMDTLCYVDLEGKFCTNKKSVCSDNTRVARTTHGGWYDND